MKYLVQFLLIIFFTSSCENNNEEVVSDPLNLITIDDKTYGVTLNGIYGNTNCAFVYANMDYAEANGGGFRLNFKLTNKGAIQNIKLTYGKDLIYYESADFDSSTIFKISNFIYSPGRNIVSFDFEGDLFKVNFHEDEIDNVHVRKYIKGKFSSSNIKDLTCQIIPNSLAFSTDKLNFSAVQSLQTVTNRSGASLVFETLLFSENGVQINFISDKDLWDKSEGFHSFSVNDFQNKVTFKKFIGKPRATQIRFLRLVDWKNFQTDGDYRITSKTIQNGEKVILGTLNMRVLDNGMLIHNIQNAPFKINAY